MEVFFGLLEELKTMIGEAKRVPLTGQFVINRENALSLLQELHDALPDALLEADQVLADEQRIRNEANSHYNSVMDDAESKARQMTGESKAHADELMQSAQAQADETIAAAQEEADRIYDDAKYRSDEMVTHAKRRAEDLVSQTSIMVEADREATRIRADARAEAQRDRLAALDHIGSLLGHAEQTVVDIANKLHAARMEFEQGDV